MESAGGADTLVVQAFAQSENMHSRNTKCSFKQLIIDQIRSSRIPIILHPPRQTADIECTNYTWHSADQSTIHEALEDLRKIMRNNRKVCVRFISFCAMSLRRPLSLSLSLALSLSLSLSDLSQEG